MDYRQDFFLFQPVLVAAHKNPLKLAEHTISTDMNISSQYFIMLVEKYAKDMVFL